MLPAIVIVDRWHESDAHGQRAALRCGLVMAAGFAGARAMATCVDEGLTAGWPAWVRALWVAGIFLFAGSGLLAWKRLMVDGV